MDSLESLIKKAQKFKKDGYSDKEIATELNVNKQTASWLITRATTGAGEKPPVDASVGWRSIGVFPHRLQSMAEIMLDVAQEEIKEWETLDAVVAVPIASIPLATLVAFTGEKELIIFRFPEDSEGDPEPAEKPLGSIYSNFANVEGKSVMVVDDVLGTGTTMRTVIGSLNSQGANVRLALVMVNKSAEDSIMGVPLRGLYRVKVIG